ncbi:unnamed protein product, partial [Rhizoctonia solani]
MSLVRAFTHLANQLRAPEALHTLKRVADLVHPIMKKHGWVLPVLAEFFPDDERLLGEPVCTHIRSDNRAKSHFNLPLMSTSNGFLITNQGLNINSGDKILIRLRPARSPGTFYPIEQLVRVMLHELTHNVHGPHDERFYTFLNKLEDEYDALLLGGWRGTGFYAPGERLGSRGQGLWGSGERGNFDTDGRRKALQAAETRLRAEGFRSGGRLGGPGSSARSGKTRQDLAAEAAERRRIDEQLCAAAHPSADREATRAAIDSITSVVEDADLAEALQLSSVLAESKSHLDPEGVINANPSTSHTRATVNCLDHGTLDESIIEISDSDSDSDNGSVPQRARPSLNIRQCPSCTYINPAELARELCMMCETPLSNISAQSQEGMWACVVCTLSNQPTVGECGACGFPKERKDWAPKRIIHDNGEPSGVEQTSDVTWTCELCTLINVYASRVCSLCDAPCPLIVPPSSGPSHAAIPFAPRPHSQPGD